jgi:hypothetical protein
MTRFVSTKVIARELHVSPETVRVYARSGMIPSQATPGGHRRYDLDAVVEALSARSSHADRETSELRTVDGRVSLGRPSDVDRLAAGPRVNFEARGGGTLPPEVAALAAGPTRASADRVAPPAPYADNRVHAALMAWASPAEAPTAARPFPDLTEDLVLRPLRSEIARRWSKPNTQVGAFVHSLLGVWASAYETPVVEVYFIMDPSKLAANISALSDGAVIDRQADVLMRASQKRIAASGRGLQVTCQAATLDSVPADKLLMRMRQVDLELLPAGVHTATAEAAAQSR